MPEFKHDPDSLRWPCTYVSGWYEVRNERGNLVFSHKDKREAVVGALLVASFGDKPVIIVEAESLQGKGR